MSDKSPFEVREVTSRRGGRVKVPLSRELIVETTLALLTREGLHQLSLRKVATLLDTGPASLYAYVANQEQLRALVLDRALASVKIPATSTGTWRVRLQAILDSYFDVLCKSPGLAQLAMESIATGPNALRMMNALLGLLVEGGVDVKTAAWAVDLLQLHVTANAAEKTNWRGGPDPLAAATRDIGGVSVEDFPHVHAARRQLLSGAGRERSAWAFNVLIDGILTNPVSESRAPRRAQAKPPRRAR